MATTVTAKPGKNGYKILFDMDIVIMNKTFATAAAKYGTPEYEIIKGIHRDFPNMKEAIVSGREKKTAHVNSRLTYANMEKHIQAYENSDELLEVFETVKALSAPLASPYKYVSDWFKAQFPDYNKALIFKDGKLTVLPAPVPNINEYKLKKAKVS